ncbi:MAG: cyclase family protein [Oscillospiraceae bacterium]|nr:cyclase family protein [Oscillospiraceae bacterium]
MKIVDLSVSIIDGLPVDPEFMRPQIEYHDHASTAEQMATFFPGATAADLPEGNGWAVEFLRLSTHTGTHMDSPLHYYPTMNGGERAWGIDEVPLDWCISPGVKVDMSDKPDGYKITVEDMIDYFAKVNYTLKPGDIVLLHTSAPSRWGSPEFLVAGAGMSGPATEWLIDQGVKVMGTDGWSWDVPLPFEGIEFQETKDPSVIWEAHRVGRYKAYCHIEKLTNLDQLPVSGYTVSCLPVKIQGGSGGWCRAVAIFAD